jgi:hypothetical protein
MASLNWSTEGTIFTLQHMTITIHMNILAKCEFVSITTRVALLLLWPNICKMMKVNSLLGSGIPNSRKLLGALTMKRQKNRGKLANFFGRSVLFLQAVSTAVQAKVKR